MNENLVLIGSLLIFFGILLIFLGAISDQKNSKVEWGFFGLIGPIPFGFWSSKKIFILSIVFMIIILMILVLMRVIEWL
ncbi:MAG: DUF131 domain-containing protein [Candidatus Aenigmatarchaeota archaeon]